MAAHRKLTLQGIAPPDEDDPSSGVRSPASSSPPSGVRLLVPHGVPRPTSNRPPRIVPPQLQLTSARNSPARAVSARAVSSREERREPTLLRNDPSLDEAPTEVDFPPPPAPTPSERARVRTRERRAPAEVKIPALPDVVKPREPRDVIPPAPGSKPVPSLIMTSQNWPIVRAPVPTTPRFGISYDREELRSLPAFVVPRAMLRPAIVEGDEVARSADPVWTRDGSTLDEAFLEATWMHDAAARSRRRATLIALGGFVFVVVAILLAVALR